MKKIILSGINFDSGGPLIVMQDALKYLDDNLSREYEVIALVHDKNLYKKLKNIKFIEFRDSKKSWIKRIYYEYFYFKKISKRLKPFLWLSMHDITPNVVATKQAVYCHNALPFYKMSSLEKFLDKKLWLFNKFYKYLYKINIRKNNYVIVQQDWIRQKFKKLFKVNNIIVAYPDIDKKTININKKSFIKNSNKKIFFYASYPRVFKNFEIICEVAKRMEDTSDFKNVKFILTIDGTENKYSQYLYKKFGNLSNIDFIGLISREEVFEYYQKSEALIFPSKLETWGLPITEYKNFNKPIFLSDLEYSKESIGEYDKTIFFDPYNSNDLFEKIIKYIRGDILMTKTKSGKIEQPFVKSWKELFNYLIDN